MRRKRLMSFIGLDWRLSKNKGEQKMWKALLYYVCMCYTYYVKDIKGCIGTV